eukprot:CAMPEP_0170543234 /NCGR_PEP_ID=MMETSP0211-20121228/2420_1 /TAXON_ID=311385 /ORGANISM="Pseudokeronopsis sp., Strain OXSARD2" /LENGTH=55 /DNA_ID=CAMNT_0010846557 /DNA_START=108 /DNA_END=275 /DNA_ORIENTATION=+
MDNPPKKEEAKTTSTVINDAEGSNHNELEDLELARKLQEELFREEMDQERVYGND